MRTLLRFLTLLYLVLTGTIPAFSQQGPFMIRTIFPLTDTAGSTVSIYGRGFTGTTSVKFGRFNATSFVVVSDTLITAVVPNNGGNIGITTPAGSLSVPLFGINFDFYPSEPYVASFSPTSAPTGGTIVINGRGLTNVQEIYIGGIQIPSFTIVSDSVIDAVVGTTPIGVLTVSNQLDNPYSIDADTLEAINFRNQSTWPDPLITSFSPLEDTAGATVTITGANFTGVTSVSLGGKAAQSFTVLSPTEIQAVVAPGATSESLSGFVYVMNASVGGDSLSGYEYIPQAPLISSFTPAKDTLGDTVTIIGSHLTGASAVTFGGQPAASFTIVGPTMIKAVLGAGATGQIKVTTTDGIDSLAGFTFGLPASTVPQITSFTPTSDSAGGVVRISGTHFTGATSVMFGDSAAASFTVVSDTVITAIVGKGATGNIQITSPAGVGASASSFLFYIPFPGISGYNPGQDTAGGTILITGLHLNYTTQVTFGTVPAASFTIISPDTILAIVGKGGASGNVTVRGKNGADSLSGFIFLAPTAQITGITPATDTLGGTITISGPGVGVQIQSVLIGGVPAAAFTVVSDTLLTAVVGANAASGQIEVITATDSAFSSAFALLRGPIITSFSPKSDTMGGSDTLYGRYFTGATQVFFGSEATLGFRVLSDSMIIAATINSSGLIRVVGPLGTGQSVDTFTYIPFIAPTVTSFSPASDTAGGTIVVKGANFQNIEVVQIGSATTGFTVVSDSMIDALVPFGASGRIAVTARHGTGISIDTFHFTPPPVIALTSFAPTSDTAGGIVIITGAGLNGVDQVNIGAWPVTFTVLSSTTISIVIPSGIPSGAITLFMPGDTLQSTTIFTVLPPQATLTSFTPTSDSTGGVVTIRGTNLSHVTGVLLGGTSAVVSAQSDTLMTVTVGTGSTGPVTLIEPGADTVVSNQVFTYLQKAPPPATPAIASFTPSEDTAGGIVIIKGVGFGGTIKIQFGGTPAASFMVVSDSIIEAIVPKSSNSGKISVIIPGDTLTSTASFTYLSNPIGPQATFRSFSPSSDSTGGIVTIIGTNLTYVTGVLLGGTSASFSAQSDTLITVTVGSGSTGPITLVEPGDANVVSAQTFTYLPGAPPPPPPAKPVIFSFSPTSDSTGAQVTIQGAHFTGATSVDFGETSAQSFAVVSDSTITAIVGSGSSGEITVTTSAGLDTLVGFTYLRKQPVDTGTPPPPAPAIDGFTPAQAATGAQITITGHLFTGATQVTFGGTPATSFTVLSDSVITATVGFGSIGFIGVTGANGSVGTSSQLFEYIVTTPPPTITSFSPAADTAGGTVTITGTNLTPTLQILFGNTPAATFSVTSPTTITAVVGNGSTGPVTLRVAGDTITTSGTFTFLPKPARFVLEAYNGIFVNNAVAVSWTVENDAVVSEYILQKSTDSVTYLTINTQTPGAFNYSYQDTSLMQGNNYYLLRVVDTSGNDLVDTVVKVVVPTPVRVNSSPNPAKGTVHVQVPNSTMTSTLQLINTNGTVVQTVSVPAGIFQVTLNVMGVPSGIYILLWQNGSARTQRNVMIAN